LGHVTPVAKLKEWQKTHPELFVKKVYNQLRPDIYLC
ncbi:MAG: IS481 family transposase, partial [Gammaproteobacteria bacterium]|nr:IS481 family transposase [Gammaproteobacteria bacterium]